MNTVFYLTVTPLLLLASACSTEAWYSGSKASHSISCLKESKSDYETCIKENPHSHDEYIEAKKELQSTTE